MSLSLQDAKDVLSSYKTNYRIKSAEIIQKKKELQNLKETLELAVSTGATQEIVSAAAAAVTSKEDDITTEVAFLKLMNTSKQNARTVLYTNNGIQETGSTTNPFVVTTASDERTKYQTTGTNSTSFTSSVGITGALSVSDLLSVKMMSEKFYHAGTLTSNTMTMNYNNGAVCLVIPMDNASNIALQVTNIPTGTSYITYNIAIIFQTNTGTNKQTYCNAITVNDTSLNMRFSGGSSAISVSSATWIIQTFSILFGGNTTTPVYCLTSVSSYQT